MSQDQGVAMPTAGQLAFPFPVEGRYDCSTGAAYLGVSARTLQRWVQEDAIGYIRLGRRVYFTKTHLDEALARRTRAASPVAKTRKARAS